MSEETGGALGPAEVDAFFAQPLVLKLACLRPDGWPYVAAPGQAYAQLTTWSGGPWHRRYYRASPSAPPPTAIIES